MLSTGEFVLCLCLYTLLGFVGKTLFSFAMETFIQIMTLCIGICHYMSWKSKIKTRASWLGSDSDWRKIDKGFVYPNVYCTCSITATMIKSNFSNTTWYMMKNRQRPYLWMFTGQFQEHLTETRNEPRAKKGCHGRWLKLVEVGFQSFFSPSLSVFLLVVPPYKMFVKTYIQMYIYICVWWGGGGYFF